ncbi:hypothetical protein KSP40_PGU006538 [Platanthera guangdongensis]|uniref:AAA+ ATPase domain-containing protein n=1 Tax=Platanthera guangdongensis TaxID=2320717 RepID=A0ABR2N365_9ASPA
MVEKYVAPSELHLKKELIYLQKARMLRDPETCSSLRSPLSSKSFAACNLYYEDEVRDTPTRENISRLLPEIPPRIEKSRKKVYLYNWKHHSSKSSESGIKLDEDGKQPSVESYLEDNLSNPQREETLGDRFLLPAPNIYNGRNENLGTTIQRRSGIRLKKSAISSRRVRKHASNLKQLDLPSKSTRILSSVEQSDDIGQCNSEDEHHLPFDLLYKDSHHSPCTSSLFSGSRCTNWPRSSTIFRNTRSSESPHSCTPASTSSYYRRVGPKPSTAGSWCGTASFEGDEFDQLEYPVRQRCGLPCYLSKRTKDRSCRDCYSPSLCDNTKKVGDGVFCGSQKMYNAKRSIGLGKSKPVPKSSQLSPLLINDYVNNTSSDEPLTNLGELDLEALSRLDGRRWSSCKSQDPIKVSGSRAITLDITDDKSLCVKYKPRIFDEIIGQNIVVQSLMNAILRNKIAPAYLFHGPCGTGKTSVAGIFSAALNCLAIEGNKPCCLCKACTTYYGESGHFVEVHATNKKGIDSIRYLLKNMTLTSRLLQYRILIIDECHLLTSKMWSALLKYLEDPISHVVLILITNGHENLPRAIISRCQKYQFSKVKDADIVRRLRQLSAAENLEIEIDALNLIASNSDGSLQDAETMLYQLSLLGKRITTSLVNDLLGVVSDEKLLDLLELAMSSKAEETVRLSRELMDSGVDPTVLVSQLAGVMMDIVAGTYQLAHSQYENVVLGGRSLTKDELKRLQQALKTLSDAEKQFKQSTEHSSLLTSALLQLASGQNMESIQPKTVEKYGNQVMKDNMKKRSSDYDRAQNFLASRESSSVVVPSHWSTKSNYSVCRTSIRVLRSHDSVSNAVLQNIQSNKRSSSEKPQLAHNSTGSPVKLSEIWRSCIEKCYSKTLKQFLSSHGKLVSVTENAGILIAFIAFADCSLKSRAERYVSSITNSLEIVLKKNVEIRMGIVPNDWRSLERPLDSLTSQPMEKSSFLNNQRKIESDGINGLHDNFGDNLDFPQERRDDSVSAGNNIVEKNSSLLHHNNGFELESCSDSSEGNIGSTGTKEKGTGISFLKAHLPFSIEQKLENAWLQDAEKGISGLPNLSRADANLAIHPNSGSSHLYCDPSITKDKPSRNQEDEPKHEIKALETNSDLYQGKAQGGDDKNHHTILPSQMHCNSFGTNFDQQNSEYESGPGCSGLFCWKTNNSHRQRMKDGSHLRSQKTGHMLFKKQVKSKKGGSRSRR